MKTKENIKELLEKYFDAKATLEEEALIRKYFAGEEIDPELESDTTLFRAFSREREDYVSECGVDEDATGLREETESAEIEVVENRGDSLDRRIRLRRRYYLMSIAGAAAVFVLGLFLLFKERGNPILIINGEKIYNTELAIAMAGESFDSMNMAIEKIQSNRVHLEKIGKVGEIMSSLEEMSRGLSQNGEEDRLNSELKDGI